MNEYLARRWFILVDIEVHFEAAFVLGFDWSAWNVMLVPNSWLSEKARNVLFGSIDCVWRYTENKPGRNGRAMSVLQIVDQRCRICSKNSTKITSLSEIINGRTLAEMLRYCVTIEVFEGDYLPFQCCVDCKSDLIVAYNLAIRCKESDALFRSQLSDSKDALRLLPYEFNNATNANQLKTEFKTETECVYVEPDLYTSNDEQSNMLTYEKNGSSSNFNNDDEIGEGYMQVDDREDDNETNRENNVDDSDDESVFERELRRCVKTKTSSSPKRCCKCKTRLENVEQVEQHSKMHIMSRITDVQITTVRPFECSVCFNRYTKKRFLLRHQREMYIEKKFQCEECDKEFLTESQLANHKESHDKDNSDRKEQLTKCCACYQQFESEELLRKHADEIHLPESQSSTNDNEKKFICDICHRRYKTKRTLLDHKSKPYRNEQNMCTQCGKMFREKRFLIDHERLHQGDRPLVCPVCSKTFAVKDSYRKHVKSHSIEKDRFKCEICSKGFRKKTNLKSHYITHRTDYRPMSCSICSASFARKATLKLHMRLHTGEKPHKCNMCDASFACPSNLKQHIMAHEGIKPYACHICGKRYPRQDYLRRHMVSHIANN
ncbi:gastrula zinc finger protein XlCGF26.1-like [Toxorhynchites rutilus septentrionalis]|uniref:gastrula zinc finger protein XlCGF26.1-like n=1 Tax=Toxorhynchites rutilus septentrionalis TaxID=329112 RepID=UPI00247AC94D|nr:gastrula zinc finger protein XlCGF26.1-like [Toxorhynchites rutilus septentrionalis]